MKSETIEPHRVTTPIQLLAAWLVGLISVIAAFLTGAATISRPNWAAGILVVAAVCSVPVFLVAIFLLQTRFRPEMQEDTFYSKYLESKTGPSTPEPTSTAVDTLRREVTEVHQAVRQLAEGVQESLRDISAVGMSQPASPDEEGVNERIVSIQERISQLQLDVAEPDGRLRWSNKKISVNKGMPFYPRIARLLSDRHIPIHETFGSTDKRPEKLVIAVGAGFDVAQLRDVVGTLAPLGEGVVNYATWDQYPGEYDNTILIGSYGPVNGIPLQDAVALLKSPGMTEEQFYTILGIKDDYSATDLGA